jgi:hypothetical protein
MNKLLEVRIKKIIKTYFLEGKADKLKTAGYEEIKLLIKRSGGLWKDYKSNLNTILKGVESDLLKSFSNDRKSEVEIFIKEQYTNIFNRADSKLSGSSKKAQDVINKSLQESEKTDKKWEDIARKALTKLKIEERHIRTEIETTKAALDNIKRFSDFEVLKDDLILRYEGPDTEREFCIRHLGKEYSFREVSEMKNQFGQPAFAFCGGYNCRHRWVPVIKK